MEIEIKGPARAGSLPWQEVLDYGRHAGQRETLELTSHVVESLI